jgi:cellobiose phosphorylase
MYTLQVHTLFRLTGDHHGLANRPKLPSHSQRAPVTRRIRGSIIDLEFTRDSKAHEMRIVVDDTEIAGNVVRDLIAGQRYQVQVVLPR